MDDFAIDEQFFNDTAPSVMPEMLRITGLLDFLRQEGMAADYVPPKDSRDVPGIMIFDRGIPSPLYLTYNAVDPDDLNRFFLSGTSFVEYPKDPERLEDFRKEINLYEGELFLARIFESPGKEGFFVKASMPEYGGISPAAIHSFLRQFLLELRGCPR